MLQAQDMQQKRTRALSGVAALIFSALLVAGAVIGGTHAYLMSKTDTYVNTFVSGLPDMGEFTIEGKKSLEGRTMAAGEFTFELYGTGADFAVADGATPLQVKTNAAEGDFAFDTLRYDSAGTFYYVVAEKEPAQGEEGFLDYVTYDKTQYRVTVKVTESDGAFAVDSEIVAFDPEAAAAATDQAANPQVGDGNAAGEGAAPVDGEGAENPSQGEDPEGGDPDPGIGAQNLEYTGTEVEAITFANKFDSPDPTVVINGVKTLEGREMKVGDFKFDLFEADSEYKVEAGADPVESVSNKDAGAKSEFGFAALFFSEKGTYYYVIKENSANPLGGVSYDDAVYRLKIAVTKNDSSGMLSAGAVMYAQDASGNWFAVDKLQPNAEGVLENGEGKPYVAAAPQNDKNAVAFVAFANAYEAAPASHEFVGDVDLEGRDMAEGEFSFVVEPQGEAPAPGVSNDTNAVDGGFGFGSVTFDKPGEYHYLIKQDTSAALEGVTYDERVHRVIVTVTDDGNGNLVASVIVLRDGVEVADGTGVKYVNKYVKGGDGPDGPGEGGGDEPDDPVGPGGSDDGDDPTLPGGPGSGSGGSDLEQTGDATMLIFGAFALVAVGAVVVGAVAFAKMRRRS